jgi:Tol biopolymer transport system component
VKGGFHHTVALIDVVSRDVKFIPGQRWAALTSLSWLDSHTLTIAAQAENTSDLQVWRLDTATGFTTRVTDDQFTYETISAALDGRSIMAVKVRETSHVWLIGDQQAQLTAGFDSKDGARGLGFLPDGSILYHSIVSGRDAIWRANVDGSGASHVVDDTEGGFSVSPDGQWLVFQGRQQTDHLGLKAINLVDGRTRDLTHGVTAEQPSFFPDGKRIAFAQYVDKLTVQETTIDGGPQKTLSKEFRSALSPAVSPSGRLIAFAFQRAKSDGLENGIAIFDDATKQIIAIHPVKIPIGGRFEEPTLGWSADESEVYFIQFVTSSVSNIMRLRLDNGAVSNVTNFADGRIFNFAVEPGGTRMLIARGLVERDATLLQIDN